MANRYAAGFTIAGFPLTAALLAVSAGNLIFGGLLGAVFVAISVLVVAPRLPLLNRLPVVGAVRLRIAVRANASPAKDDGEIRLEAEGDSFPQSILVEVEIENEARQDATHALITVGCPTGHDLTLCDSWGTPSERGRAMLPYEGFDRISIGDQRFTAGDSALLNFRFRVREPGIYAIFISVNSGSLYRTVETSMTVRVAEVERPCLRDRLGPVITEAEKLSKEGADAFRGDSALRQGLMTLTFTATKLLLDDNHQALANRFTDAEPDFVGVKSGEAYFRASAQAHARRLVEIRDQLGREEERGLILESLVD